jgi:hypothetical protein
MPTTPVVVMGSNRTEQVVEAIKKGAQNPPPKRRYGYFNLSEGAFFLKFQKKIHILLQPPAIIND